MIPVRNAISKSNAYSYLITKYPQSLLPRAADPAGTQNVQNVTGTPSTSSSRRFPKDDQPPRPNRKHMLKSKASMIKHPTSDSSCSRRISGLQPSPTRSLVFRLLSFLIQTDILHLPSYPYDRLINRSHKHISRPHHHGAKHAQPQEPAHRLLRRVLHAHHPLDPVGLNSRLVPILARFAMSRHELAAHDVVLEEP